MMSGGLGESCPDYLTVNGPNDIINSGKGPLEIGAIKKQVSIMVQLTVSYPESLPDVLQESRVQFEAEARMAMASKLFELKRVSSGTAALLAGMDRVSFLLRLHEYGVAMIDLEDSEIEEDLANA